jgi:peptide-methionine (S)-S-oxide reductase
VGRLVALSMVAACLIAPPLLSSRARDTHLTSYGRKAKAHSMAKATFGAGCFWGVEAAFRKVRGVISTTVGYTGGTAPNPTYEQVCAGGTGHTESVEIVYDPAKVSYDQLLQVFLRIHDPTERYKAQYKSVIFYHTPEQKAAAEAALKRLQASGALREPIVTEVLPAQKFYPAEEYHQQYYEKQGVEGDVCAR